MNRSDSLRSAIAAVAAVLQFFAGAGEASGYGYKAGASKVENLLKAVPKNGGLAQLRGEHVASIGCHGMTNKV